MKLLTMGTEQQRLRRFQGELEIAIVTAWQNLIPMIVLCDEIAVVAAAAVSETTAVAYFAHLSIEFHNNDISVVLSFPTFALLLLDIKFSPIYQNWQETKAIDYCQRKFGHTWHIFCYEV